MRTLENPVIFEMQILGKRLLYSKNAWPPTVLSGSALARPELRFIFHLHRAALAPLLRSENQV